ncbi:bacillithiol system redox-active protein YtxJ [Aureivirga sp. CE67]|uniref:bacillithiol system redox-active protein YtxJ n=1 Tax=Aureivirga sp. CE67 TaxID=1788983 RepID=UPI0018CB4755|nr:bacillithiol system redox-active protein YtxJ [Aureivirga sp. CE67]
MGILKNIFKSTDTNNAGENKPSPWKELRDLKTLDEIKEISKEKPVVIFKHSTRCGVSRGVLRQFERSISDYKEADFYYLDLLQHRSVSNAIAEIFHVIHQSPQMLIIKNGEVVKHESHYQIAEVDLKRYLS